VAKEGETEPLAESSYSFFYTRGVSVEVDLEAGNYVVLVSLVENSIPSFMTLAKGFLCRRGWTLLLCETRWALVVGLEGFSG